MRKGVRIFCKSDYHDADFGFSILATHQPHLRLGVEGISHSHYRLNDEVEGIKSAKPQKQIEGL
jgi:hypothetical protein